MAVRFSGIETCVSCGRSCSVVLIVDADSRLAVGNVSVIGVCVFVVFCSGMVAGLSGISR